MNTQVGRIYSSIKRGAALACMMLILPFTSLAVTDFDHAYTQYDALLKDAVHYSPNKKQTRVDYQQLVIKQPTMSAVQSRFSSVTQAQFDGWSEAQQLSFLINAYNFFTLQLIVDNWSDFKLGKVDSIRDLGSLFSSPWKLNFFNMLGKKRNLDDIEHEMIRKGFKEPRIHAALVCAAVSCPPLRNDAFVADDLDEQLDSQMRLFLADNSRNEIITQGQSGKVYLSSIFKWYQEDFEKGDGGFDSLYEVLTYYIDALVQGDNDQQAQRNVIKQDDFPIMFKDYDWRLNDVANF
ncbi:DUF547 domain-containing protein [Paraglaciecola sp.]|uniref:DUF547 domain-containing protein n=1 Tax=Paraglaciecola sp. TaxID=1920173 RepID=UPI00273F348F|nr:DUF547 domain-containing protein [Paraglaciecola sp.]MDP5033071.1 DUF547 domain-containing protein [Paraglaciecola sp.]